MAKLALKRLADSDLTFFACKFYAEDQNVSTKQKCINLNANPFIKVMFPGLKEKADKKFLVSLCLFGPGMKGGYQVDGVRSINKSKKNWRLNGLVGNPAGDSSRFDALQSGDYAVIRFDGDDYPTAVDIVFVSASADSDRTLFQAFGPLIPEGSRNSMVQLEQTALAELCQNPDIPDAHPVRLFTREVEFEEALQEAAFGSAEGVRAARRKRGSRRTSQEDVARARSNAERVGQEGEELVNGHLHGLLREHTIDAFSWVSRMDATAPHDFEVTTTTGQHILIDAKSTEGDFQRPIHISAAELAEAAASDVPYSIYRVYQMREGGGLLRVAPDIREIARQLQEWIAQLPPGIAPDGFTLYSGALEWEAEAPIHRLRDWEGEG